MQALKLVSKETDGQTNTNTKHQSPASHGAYRFEPWGR